MNVLRTSFGLTYLLVDVTDTAVTETVRCTGGEYADRSIEDTRRAVQSCHGQHGRNM